MFKVPDFDVRFVFAEEITLVCSKWLTERRERDLVAVSNLSNSCQT